MKKLSIEEKLKALFDYQRFENDLALENLIAETEEAFGHEISDEDLFDVSAAGDPDARQKKPDSSEDKPI